MKVKVDNGTYTPEKKIQDFNGIAPVSRGHAIA